MTTEPTSIVKNSDGTYTVLYFGKVCGHIARGKQPLGEVGRWIAVTIHNDVKRLHSLASARSYLTGSFF